MEVAGGRRRLPIEKLHSLCPSSNIIKFVKSRRLRWEGNVPRIREMRNAYIILVQNLKGTYHSVDLGEDKKIILEWILGK
jgi:hypothetical protein